VQVITVEARRDQSVIRWHDFDLRAEIAIKAGLETGKLWTKVPYD